MSFWLDTPEIQQKRTTSTNDFPLETSHHIIVGGGMTGASVAYHLGLKGMKSIILEKGDLSSGATGTNGGFISPGPLGNYNELSKEHGADVAKAIYEYTMRCTEKIKCFVAQHGESCELRFNGKIKLASTDEELHILKSVYEMLNSHGFPQKWWDDSKCREECKSNSFKGGIFDPLSGNLWAAKLVAGIVDEAAKLGACFFTHTQVHSVTHQEDGSTLVQTNRGDIRTDGCIVYAVNAWTRGLLPEFDKLIVPVRNQVVITEPVERIWDFALLANNGNIYFMQRPDGRIVLGGMRDITPTKEVNSDDVESLNPSVSSALREYLPKHFSSAVPVALHSIRIEREWVGIMGFTPDSLPVIGPLAGRQRQYIAAGYTGHGMPFA